MKCFIVEPYSSLKELSPERQASHSLVTEQLHNVSHIEDADVIIPIGGDGAMLSAITQYRAHNKPFIGINAGTRGFLMNDLKDQKSVDLLQNLDVEYQSLWLLEAEVNEGVEYIYGFNDIWAERATGQTLRMRLSFDGKDKSSYIVGDGMLFSTPQGSTGYNLALTGKVIIPGVPVLQVTPIACIVNKAPLGSLILSDNSEIKINFEQISKRPARIFFDGMVFNQTNVSSIVVRRSTKTVTLGFVKHANFLSKMTSWQTRL